jgi:hypothetical protein
MSEPRMPQTEEGRALVEWIDSIWRLPSSDRFLNEGLPLILALERSGSSDPEAVGLDVERLARAMARCAEVGPPAHINPDDAEEHWPSYVAEAEEYAREYAALTEAKPESPA